MRWILLAATCSGLVGGTISGIVVDAAGHPLEGVHLDHGYPGKLVTDSDGRFSVSTPVILRKRGYESKFILTAANGELRIVLRTAPIETIPECSKKCEQLEGWGAQLCFQVPSDVHSKQGRDIDYGTRVFQIKTSSGWKGFRHASGPMWGLGYPQDSTVQSSIEYREKIFNDGSPYGIVDARGKTAMGLVWRRIGRFNESAEYFNVDEPTAKLLDKILDSVCLLPSTRR